MMMGAAGGGGLTFGLGWAYVQKLIRNIEDTNKRIQEISINLSEINIKLGLLEAHNHAIDKIKESLHHHDKLIGIMVSQKESK